MYAPAGVSPTITPLNYFWKQLAEDAAVCGPNLAWRKSSTITRNRIRR